MKCVDPELKERRFTMFHYGWTVPKHSGFALVCTFRSKDRVSSGSYLPSIYEFQTRYLYYFNDST